MVAGGRVRCQPGSSPVGSSSRMGVVRVTARVRASSWSGCWVLARLIAKGPSPTRSRRRGGGDARYRSAACGDAGIVVDDPKMTVPHRFRMRMSMCASPAPSQIGQHTGSLASQYESRERAVALGWPAHQVVVIDADLDRCGPVPKGGSDSRSWSPTSGWAGARDRAGHRRSRGWPQQRRLVQLLDSCAITDILIADVDGVCHRGPSSMMGLLGDREQRPARLHRPGDRPHRRGFGLRRHQRGHQPGPVFLQRQCDRISVPPGDRAERGAPSGSATSPSSSPAASPAATAGKGSSSAPAVAPRHCSPLHTQPEIPRGCESETLGGTPSRPPAASQALQQSIPRQLNPGGRHDGMVRARPGKAPQESKTFAAWSIIFAQQLYYLACTSCVDQRHLWGEDGSSA